MLKELKISNFRGFSDEVTVRFAPITVLIGSNNAGKSSIIKFLLMLRQSLGLDKAGFLVSQGDKIDFGKFYDLKNSTVDEKYLKFSLSIEDDSSPRDALSLYFRDKGLSPTPEGILYTVEANVLYNRKNAFQGRNHQVALDINGETILERSKNISQNSRFLDFSDEQQLEYGAGILEVTKINAENACIETLSNHIGSIRHISPIKRDIPGVIDNTISIPDGDVGANGQYAMHHLLSVMENNLDQKEFIFHQMEETLEVIDFKYQTTDLLTQFHARNKRTNAKTSIDKFGFGVSQCLPIIIQGAISNRGTTLMVEQPEAQVHPTAQLEIGQFFADLWKQRGVGSIIETHSGNILLRLRRLIRKKDLDAREVSVAFFNNDQNKTTIKNLSINEDGSFEPGLPMEFFGADVIEALELGAGK